MFDEMGRQMPRYLQTACGGIEAHKGGTEDRGDAPVLGQQCQGHLF